MSNQNMGLQNKAVRRYLSYSIPSFFRLNFGTDQSLCGFEAVLWSLVAATVQNQTIVAPLLLKLTEQ